LFTKTDTMPPTFPFSAIVGQDALKRALLLTVIQPRLGGVLIRGVKGSAKSTAVRGLAHLLPPIETVVGCPVQRHPDEVVPDLHLPIDAAIESRRVPLVELPLGATEDRVLGSLHLEKALRGERVFEPGLLAAANRGILYIDEVNLLPDHLIDVLLDAAASGVHRVEREGLSLSHPARFVLVGTMNPEEGDLRPQLLDRFGLVVDVTDLSSPTDRAEAVRRRLTFEANPEQFHTDWQAAEQAEAARIVQAQRILPEVEMPETILQAISARCLAAGAEGLRADLAVCQASAAWAAYHGRTLVEAADVDAVAELALVHRRTRPPTPPDPKGERRNAPWSKVQGPRSQAGPETKDQGQGTRDRSIDGSAGLFAARIEPAAQLFNRANAVGHRRHGATDQNRTSNGPARPLTQTASRIAWAATVRAAAPHQYERGRNSDGIILLAQDLHAWPKNGPAGCLRLFLIDTSGSMAAWRRMRQTKAAVLALLAQAYRQRDRVAMLACHDDTTELVLPPSRDLNRARAVLEELPAGGTTPLAHGLCSAGRLIARERRRQPRQPVWTVILTDGRNNVAFSAGADAEADLHCQARALARLRAEFVVVDTETGSSRFGRAAELAALLSATCVTVEDVLGRPLPERHRVAG
jgi:magnesium chelatase subunit D